MQNYIKIYRDVVDKTFCDNLVEKFESSKTQQQSWPEGKPFFTQINFSQSIEWKTESETLLNVFTDHIVKYKKHFDIKQNQWPKQYSLEPIRMKRYLPNDSDEFPPHTVCQLYQLIYHLSMLSTQYFQTELLVYHCYLICQI